MMVIKMNDDIKEEVKMTVSKKKHKKQKRGQRVLNRMLFLIALAVFLYSGFELFKIYKANYDEKKEHDRITSIAGVPENPREPFTVDFPALQAINSDVAGWIIIPDTEINYPIVKSSDNDYYLNHTFEKKVNYAGSIFIDYRQARDFSDMNTFIYGHNVYHGTMFAELEKFKDAQFFNDHPYIYLYTPQGNYRAEVMSMYHTTADSDSYKIGFRPNQVFLDYVNLVKSKSLHKREVSFDKNDRMITLSTCSYELGGVGSAGRYLVHAKLVPWDGNYDKNLETEFE